MNNHVLPVPADELNRILNLSDLDVDYTGLKESFRDITKLAAKVAGTDISLVNLIDSFTQWTIADHGISIDQMPREESVCQYTITQAECFEVKDLSTDARFKDKDYVKDENLKYYFGVPLKSSEGHNIGALCVLDKEVRIIDPEKIELLKIIGNEIINRLKAARAIEALKREAFEARDSKLKVAHDIRGPLSGIIGLAESIKEQGDKNKLDDVLQFLSLIQKSGKSILALADEILTEEKKGQLDKIKMQGNEFNLLLFKENLEKLYLPQALSKHVNLVVTVASPAIDTPFYKNKLLQITGNLISNAIKFTPAKGTVSVDLSLLVETNKKTLHIVVKDTGVGLSHDSICSLIGGTGMSTKGTVGEPGYGFGLVLVKHLVDTLKGTLKIFSAPGEGATFDILIPQ